MNLLSKYACMPARWVLSLTLAIVFAAITLAQAPAPAATAATPTAVPAPAAAAAPAIPPDIQKKLDDLDKATKNAQMAGDNSWMLTSSALVLMMTGPGLALFYGGLVRRKNVLGTMMHSFILMAVVTVIWAVAGYSLAFGGSSPYLGNFQFAFLDGVGS